jgi:hypothetical protein
MFIGKSSSELSKAFQKIVYKSQWKAASKGIRSLSLDFVRPSALVGRPMDSTDLDNWKLRADLCFTRWSYLYDRLLLRPRD